MYYTYHTGITIERPGENSTPISPSLQFGFKYSFTMKYIRFCRQVFFPFKSLQPVFESRVHRVGRLHCRLRLELCGEAGCVWIALPVPPFATTPSAALVALTWI